MIARGRKRHVRAVFCHPDSATIYAKRSAARWGHAEIQALAKAGDKARGARLRLRGNSYCCKPCLDAMHDAVGVEIVIVAA